jgi:hypothetical protein
MRMYVRKCCKWFEYRGLPKNITPTYPLLWFFVASIKRAKINIKQETVMGVMVYINGSRKS